MLRDNKLIRKNMHNFAQLKVQNMEEELMAQTGENDAKIFKENNDKMPFTDGKKDGFCFRSVKTVKSACVSPSKNSR